MNLNYLIIALKLLLISATYLVTTYFLADFVYEFITKSSNLHFIAFFGIYFLMTVILCVSVIKTLTGE
jgi:hypothetical protein